MADMFHFSLDRSKEAAERWARTAMERAAAAQARADGRYDEIDTTERIVKHANRLRSQLMEQLASPSSERAAAINADMPSEVMKLATGKKVVGKDITPRLVERVIGATKDFLSAEFFELGVYAMRSVARITTDIDGQVYYGTGFMVSPNLLLTNQHVLEKASWAQASIAEFDYQRDRNGAHKTPQSFNLEPSRFFLNDAFLDYALVAVSDKPSIGKSKLADFGFCPLVGIEGKILQTDPVNIVQHPMGRMKEVVIRENQLSALPQEADMNHLAQYVADTEQGSSGSPVFNDRWEVIALHHLGIADRDQQGNFLTKDGKIWNDTMSEEEIKWIGNEGIRISRIVKHLGERADVPAPMKPLLAGLLKHSNTKEIGPVSTEGLSEPEPKAEAAAPVVLTPSLAADGRSGTATITIPVTITIQVDGGHAVTATVAGRGAVERVQPARDYAGRPGFDAGFLGVDVPMPTLVDDSHGQPAELADASTELKYYHFSVLMNADRRMAYVSAANYDAAAPFTEERGDDDWFIDPRIDASFQADNRFYKNNPLDRGHLTRRFDAGWGQTEEEAKLANDDTFHWTNCSPQHEVFNQSKLSQPKDLRLWGELENHVTDQAKQDTQRLSIFNGPVFGKDDRTHRGLLIPSAFWKIIAYQSHDNKLGAVGFVLHQADLISNLAAERFDVGKFDLRQVRISRIEELTGLDFKLLRNVDPMAATGVREVFEGTTAIERKLNAASDIRF